MRYGIPQSIDPYIQKFNLLWNRTVTGSAADHEQKPIENINNYLVFRTETQDRNKKKTLVAPCSAPYTPFLKHGLVHQPFIVC